MPGVRRRRRLILIWLSAAILTSLTSYGELSTIDSLTMLESARHLAAGGLPVVERTPGGRGIDGRIYAKYAPANTLVLIPAAWAGAGVARLGYPESMQALVEEFVASHIAVCARAGVAVLVFVLLDRLRPNSAANIGLALLSLIGAFDSQYGRSYYSEVMVQLAVLGATTALVDVATGGARVVRRAWMIGALCAMSFAFRYETAVFVPVFAALLLGVSPRAERRPALLAFGIPVAVAALVIGAFNTFRFGAPWTTGYEEAMFVPWQWSGWIGILVSPGAGLLWFAPVALGLLFPATWAAESGAVHRLLRRTLLALLAADVLVCGSFFAWSGSAWGPRFLAGLMPLLFVCVFASWFKNVAARRVGLGLLSAGMVMNLLLLVAPHERSQVAAMAAGWTNEQRLWSIAASPLLQQPRMTREVMANLGDLDQFSARAASRLGTRGTSDRFNPNEPREMLRTSVLLNVPALWWFKAMFAGVPGWVSGVIVLFGLLAAAAAIAMALHENRQLQA
jgi:hypothetical protein